MLGCTSSGADPVRQRRVGYKAPEKIIVLGDMPLIGIVAQEDRRGYAESTLSRRPAVTLTTILLIILILILIGVIPTWPHSRDWGYVPGGVVGVILIILLILLLMGRI